ncbi:uncharacterized protein PF3D7_1120600 isoform X2 [Condylostylus longicornis]|uniref:uncharacterized protein PF3D7_1120600 isoform X2 n=1 Tax=Condylostylus longicornis TaxID=2530218 RepID=UPI00244E1313|nr:uncharacterized protein PF3D7_1120600 isoform X2 [Condylostylus longicornis]
MWSPTHVQVTVQRAKGLLTKGKNGTNNCFVTIALGKDKYQTSIREKASQNVEWHEECELAIPEKGNTAELILTCLHHNSLGIDEFLGQVTLPLRDMDAYDTPRPKWFKLQSKPGQEKKDKERGELEVRINFTVKAGSLSDLSKKEKHKSSFNQLASSVGGSLLSIGTLEKKKGIKKIATSIGSKLHLTGKKKDKKGGGGDVDSESFTGSMASIGTPNSSLGGSRKWNGRSYIGNTDPGVADDGDINFDRLSQRSSISNISYAQEHNINNSPTINRPSVTISSQNNFSNGVPENKNVPQNGDKSMGNQNNSNSNINVNQMDSDSTPSLKRRIWGKTRVPLPIPERSEDELLKNGSQKYDIRNSHFENEDHDVVLRAKDEPILQESRNSQMLDVPETHKPKPRQFLPSNTDDDFALDNLSCNSSPFSSLTSQSYYDYNPNNDSVRLSNKVEEDDEDSGFGTFSRGDSKRRASRKKYFAPVLKEREIEKRFEESMHNVEKEIIIDFEPQNNSKFEENKNEIEINSDTEISANPMYYSDNFFKKPDPPARRVKNSQIHNSPNFVKIEHENISAEYQFAEKYEKVNPESIAISTNKAKIIETRNEEVVKFNTGVAEITQVAPPLKVELEDIDNIATYERQPDTVIEKYPYFVSHKNEVSNLTIQLEKPFEEENVEILGSKNESVPDLNESNCNKNCEVHENQYKSFPLCEESTNKVSVSNIRSRFEQNSPRNNSILISSKDNSKLELECSQENSYNRKSSEININLTLITPANEEKVFEKMKMEHYATKTMPIERFEKAPLQSKAVEYSIARELGIVKEEAFAVECCTKEVVENFTSQNLAVKSNVVQILEVKKEQNVAVECAIAEVFENAHVNNIANEIYVKEQIETRNEEDFAIECNIAQAFENAVIKSMAKETYVKQEFENRKEENLAVELNMVEVFENTMVKNIANEAYVKKLFETRGEQNIAIECNLAEVFENAVVKNIVNEVCARQEMATRLERNLVVECGFPDEFENAQVKNITNELHLKQEHEIRNEENIVVECSFRDVSENAKVQNIANVAHLKQEHEIRNEEHIAVQCSFPEIFESTKEENMVVESYIKDESETLTEENFVIHCNSATAFENLNFENVIKESYIPKVYETCTAENIATSSSTAEPCENSVAKSIMTKFEICENLDFCKEENFVNECHLSERFVKANSQEILLKMNIPIVKDVEDFEHLKVVPFAENPKQINIIPSENLAKVFKKTEFEHVAINNVQNSDNSNEENITSCDTRTIDRCETVNSKIILANENVVQMNDTIESQKTEINKEIIELNKTKEIQNINSIPIPKPRSPVNFNESLLNKSSSNILQMIENKEEDYSDSKFEKSFKIPNSSSTITSEDEDDYESQYSEPELKTNKLNITKNVGNDSQTKTDSKVFQSIDFESNEANTKIPIARPRNPNAEVFNNLAESSSSNCSSLENMYLTVVVPKRVGNQDPGVIEDDDEFVFDKLSHKSSGSSLNISRGHNDYNHRIPSPVISKEEDRNSSKIPSPPAKPPRNASDQKLDEWESKLYGNHLEIGSTDSLKRRSWGNNRIPLNTAEENEEPYEDVKLSPSSNTSSNGITKNETTMNDINISPKTGVKSQQRNDVILETPEMNQSKENIEKISEEKPVSPKIAVTNAEVTEKKESKLEKLLNKSPLLRTQSREALDNSDLNINKRSSTNNAKVRPRALPRSDTISIFTDDVIQSPEDAKEIREKLKKDQKEISEKTEKIEKKHRFGKFKYFAKRGESKNDLIEENGFHGERHNPIGHENFSENENSLPELSPELLNKYDGKSREDIILIADSFEKEMVMERNRVKELEEYLDNLLLRVMETHPKILQNPYRTTSTKRFSSFSG